MSADLLSQLETTLGGAYSIVRELGGAGMSRVFAALETSLGRRVVLKVLSPELAAGVSGQRFAREVRLAASLQHANIVPLLSAGETNGLPYYTMPFVDGPSLRERLIRGGRLPLSSAISVLRDVARALAYAHGYGVVHRDIKPENVLLSGDAAVVTDFGIAKAISAARTGEGIHPSDATAYTVAGTALGTPAYMAPEQVVSDPAVDHRADLYSFGCLAYELISGESVFAGRTVQQMLAAHLGERPTPLGEKCPACPPRIIGLVMQCLEKEPSARPQSARELLIGLEGTTAPATGLERLRNRLSRRHWRTAATAIVVLAALALPLWGWLRPGSDSERIESVAVIPFTNLGGDTAQEYLAEGMANELTTTLGKIAGIRVISRALSARYRGRSDLDAQAIGRALAVRYVLVGTVRRSLAQLSVSTQLVRAADNSEAWSGDFAGATDDLLAIQDSITRAIGRTLQLNLGGAAAIAGVPSAASVGTTVPRAYDLYMRGKLLLERRGPGVAQAVERFEQAIAHDSNFARAHAGLAVALELLPYYTDTPAVSVRVRAIRAAERALALDSTQAEAHTALGLAYQHSYEWERSLAAHRQAVALDSSDASARVQYGRLLFYLRRPAAASAEFDRARTLDPYSAVASAWVGHMLSLMGRHAEGLAELESALEIDSLHPAALFIMAQALLRAEHRDSAEVVADRLARSFPAWRARSAVLYGLLGERAMAEAILRELATEESVVAERFSTIAMIALALRDTSRALDALERATDAREPWPTFGAPSDRVFHPLLGSARFSALLRRVRLDERIFASPTRANLVPGEGVRGARLPMPMLKVDPLFASARGETLRNEPRRLGRFNVAQKPRANRNGTLTPTLSC